jgi:hypothetical protein
MKQILLFAMALISLPLFGRDSKEAQFWKWFQKNEDTVFHFEKDRERVFDQLGTALQAVNPDLTFEFGPVTSDGKREFVISAGGIKSAFPAVEAVAQSAPPLPRWIIVKYRQRRNPINNLEYGGKKVRSAEVKYLLFRDDKPGKVGVMVFIPGYTEAERPTYGQIGYLFLDEALGEYDVEMRVGAIVFAGQDSKYFPQGHALSDLGADFDRYFASQK